MAVGTATTLLRVVMIRSQLRLSALIAADLGEQFFAAVLQKPFAWHLKQKSSTVLGYLTKDVDQAFGSIQGLLLVVVNPAIVVLPGGSLIALAPAVMMLVGSLLAGVYLLLIHFTRGAMRADDEHLTSNYHGLQVAQEGLAEFAMCFSIAAKLSICTSTGNASVALGWRLRPSTSKPKHRST